MKIRSDIINFCIDKYKFDNYLEIGVSCGENIHKVNAKRIDGVDPGLGRYADLSPMVNFRMNSDVFFETIKLSDKKYDFIFIDGLHETQQVDKDIENSFKHLNENGIVMLHDTLPTSYEAQVIPRIQRNWNGDVWKSVVKLRCNNPEYTIMTLDMDEGCTLIKKGKQELYNDTSLENALDYSYFKNNKSKLMNIVSVEYFKENI